METFKEEIYILEKKAIFTISEFQIECKITLENNNVFKRIKLIDDDFDISNYNSIKIKILKELLNVIYKNPKQYEIMINYLKIEKRNIRLEKLL